MEKMMIFTANTITEGAATKFISIYGGILQRQCACRQHSGSSERGEDCRRKRQTGEVQRAAILPSSMHQAPPIVHEVLRSPGRPLDARTRAFMQTGFGQDFSQVRVHTGTQAAESARAVNALAYTVGHDIVFGAGQSLTGPSGQRLLTHELTHVVQQQYLPSGAFSQSQPLAIDSPTSAHEQGADAVVRLFDTAPGSRLPKLRPGRLTLQRQVNLQDEQDHPPRPFQSRGDTLTYREATELAECIRIMGDENRDYCHQTVLGESPPTPVRAPASLNVAPVEVQPHGTGGVDTATVVVTSATPGERIRPTVTAAANSGGHQHHNQRPVGTIRPASRIADAAGQAIFTYQSNLVSGVETIAVIAAGNAVQADIDVRVPGLVELAAGADYDLVGQTVDHPSNHFGTAATVASLQQIAADFEAHKVANNLPGWPRVAYNDISLERGGIFDINGDWAPPHQTHRVGETVDFRTNHLNAAQSAVLTGIINAAGGAILNEGNHWHLTF